MLNKVIIYTIKIFLYPLKILQKWNYYLFPNIYPLLKQKVNWISRPSFNQKIFFNGQGSVDIGANCSFGYKLGGFNYKGSIEIQARYKNSKIKIGNNISTNNNIFICAANYIEIGDNCLIGQNVIILDHEAHGIEPEKRRQLGTIGKVLIGRNVWIGNNVTILKNTEIGDNSIVAVGAIVSGEFPANVVLGGVPAKIIKQISA